MLTIGSAPVFDALHVVQHILRRKATLDDYIGGRRLYFVQWSNGLPHELLYYLPTNGLQKIAIGD
ncbi:hypothetical protein Q9L42_014395 [Methylomarinum sp. Ch1-1]|uniref:Uncharacterized protein n=1 Tax=Methylomarinum roseum TaxID=3067653 RepID=A0AAU7NRF1_9GAMM|nr:hypothetical protein [Methylomarinum sp. Ch1-1]MDP4520484.1 hypothetical protein [Methylomarinum sp. Ch1-1]